MGAKRDPAKPNPNPPSPSRYTPSYPPSPATQKLKVQNLRVVREVIECLEFKLTGYRTENHVGSHAAAQMAFRETLQQLCRHGWIPRDDLEVLLHEQEAKWQNNTLSCLQHGHGFATNVDESNGCEEYS